VVLIAIGILVFSLLSLKIHASSTGTIEGEELNKLKQKIAKHIVFDKYERSTAKLLKDVNNLSLETSFFKNAKDGDAVLILLDSNRVIVYREGDDILVNVGPIIAGTGEKVAQHD
jgi:hypothetical protein